MLLPRALGALSLGLGAALLARPGMARELAGAERSVVAPLVIRGVAARELLHAAGLLASRQPAGWVWSRVAGDAMDLALMGRAALNLRGDRRHRALMTTGALAGIALVDLAVAVYTGRVMIARRRAISLRGSITINKPSQEVYRFWRDFGNLPRFMYHLESVSSDGDGRSHWRARGPAGIGVEWDAEITEEQPNRMIAWRSTDGTKVPNSGRVRFLPTPDGRATEVRVELDYAPPAGRVGKLAAKLFGENPEQQVKDDLRRFKQVIETGEVVRSEGSPDGLSLRQQLMQRPARPLGAR
ncbi:SRPBCC family protein [Micromonospora sp. NPDC049559]|uniref:SRPBCC family protein n=1 Tax=Micromonospora sp. NPDC049559 TaxID=3155923 RepID=UPI00342A5EE6